MPRKIVGGLINLLPNCYQIENQVFFISLKERDAPGSPDTPLLTLMRFNGVFRCFRKVQNVHKNLVHIH